MREPLIWFLILGTALFGLDAHFSEPERTRIVVKGEMVGRIVEERERILGRKLSAEERGEIVERLIEIEILAREGALRGLHLTDFKLRESMASRMAFLLEDDGAVPTDAELAALRAERPERYMTPRSVSFRHAYFSEDEPAAQAALADLLSGRLDPDAAGEDFWLGRRMERYSDGQLTNILGPEFTASLRDLPIGTWTGPIRSARGWHLVRLEQFHEAEPLPPAEIDRLLRDDWRERRRHETRTAAIAALRAGYEIEGPASGSREPAN